MNMYVCMYVCVCEGMYLNVCAHEQPHITKLLQPLLGSTCLNMKESSFTLFPHWPLSPVIISVFLS